MNALPLALLLAGCTLTPPAPPADSPPIDGAARQAWARYLLCSLPDEQRPVLCDEAQ